VGRILRDFKLDELPQLWSVVRGDMALVGPRPIAMSFQQELENKIPGFSARLSVKPGITSLPQVCILESQAQERVVADWRQRFEAERHYIQNKSASYDMIVLAMTVLYILRKIGRAMPPQMIGVASFALTLSCALMLAGCSDSSMDKTGFKQTGDVMTRSIGPAGGTTPETPGVKVKTVSVQPASSKAPEQAYRIGPGEIENCLVKHPAVANAAVVPKPDAERGSVVKAYVVIAPDFIAACASDPGATAQLHAQLTLELQNHVKALLAPYEYPKEIEFVDALPMTTTGKVQRRVLRQQEEERARERGFVV
jgi:hypothetical protein